MLWPNPSLHFAQTKSIQSKQKHALDVNVISSFFVIGKKPSSQGRSLEEICVNSVYLDVITRYMASEFMPESKIHLKGQQGPGS
jgi:hypothetical protein